MSKQNPNQRRQPKNSLAVTIGAVSVLLASAASATAAPLDDEAITKLIQSQGQPGFEARFDEAIASTELDQAFDLASSVVPYIDDASIQSELYRKLGMLALAARRAEEASHLFERGYVVDPESGLLSLFLQAQTLLQLGELEEASLRARTVLARTNDYGLKRRATALVARVLEASGRMEEAARLLNTLAALDDPDLVEVDTIELQRLIAARQGDSALKGRAETQLARLFPQSLSLAAMNDQRIGGAAIPTGLLLAGVELETPVETVEADRVDEERTTLSATAIQVGSFGDPDNADHLADALVAHDLSALVTPIDRDGNRLYHVVVTVKSDDDPTYLLDQLRKLGYDGFLIY